MKNTDLLQEIRENTENNYKNISKGILEQQFKGISTDSRTIKKGEIFLALEGEKFDGHQFISDAIKRGAVAIITRYNYPTQLSSEIFHLRVKNTLATYQKIAQVWRKTLDIPLIAVTGSVGKTTTKELIFAILSQYGKVLKTEANYNNEIGVPKTILQINKNHDFAVIEMAMRAKGEIALLTKIANPTIGMITNVGTAHIGRLGSREAIAEAKCELLGNLNSEGLAILNADNDLLISTARRVWQGKTITYGLNKGDLQGEIVNQNQLKVGSEVFDLPLQGEHQALNYLGAIAVATSLGLDLSKIKSGVKVSLPQGRAKTYRLSNDIEILDETYNAGLESMLASLKLLSQTTGLRKIAVLGTMKELGEYSDQLHYQVGEYVKKLNINYLLVLADETTTEQIAQGAEGIEQEIFDDHQKLITRLQQLLTTGDRVLFKASNSVGLNKVVEAICPSNSKS